MRVAFRSYFAAIAAILGSLAPDVRCEEIFVTLGAPESSYCLGGAFGLELTFRNSSRMPIVVYEDTRRWFDLNLVVGGVVETNEISIQIHREGACEEDNEISAQKVNNTAFPG